MGLLEISFSSSYVDRLYKDIKSLRCNDIVATDLIKGNGLTRVSDIVKKKKKNDDHKIIIDQTLARCLRWVDVCIGTTSMARTCRGL